MPTEQRTPQNISNSQTNVLIEAAILIIAALARFWRLNYHSVWFDEAVSLRWAGVKPFNVDLFYMVSTTFQLVEEKHPPGYYALLYGWREIMTPMGLDQSDVAMRSLGAILGVATVVGVLLLVRHVSSREVAQWTALFVALSPVLVWYSQEIRMFQPATTFVVWGLYGQMRAWSCPKIGRRILWWLFMILSFEMAVYSYLFSAFVLPAVGVCLLLLFLQNEYVALPQLSIPSTQRAWRFVEGCTALAIVTAIFLPLAWNAWQVNGHESTPGQPFADFPNQTRTLFKIFTIWRENWPSPLVDVALIFLGSLLVIGLVSTFLQKPTHQTDFTTPFFIVCWLAGPLLLGNLLLANNQAVFKEDRYHIYLTPFVLWAIALGVVQLMRIRRYIGWSAGLLVAIMLAAILPRFWTNALLREDWRAAAVYIDHYQQQSSGLPSAGVAHINYTHQPMDWYIQQHYTFEELPIFGLFGDPLTEDMIDHKIAPPLKGIVDYGAKTLWLTQSHLEGIDDARIVEQWLRDNFPVITEQYPAGIKLTGFALQSHYNELPPLHEKTMLVDTELVPGVYLVACEIMTPKLSATDTRLHPPNGWVHVRIWFQATAQVDVTYAISVEAVDMNGVWGKALVREGDTLAHFPTSSWSMGPFVRTELDVNLNPEIPTGEYEIRVGLRALDVPPEKWTKCGDIVVHS